MRHRIFWCSFGQLLDHANRRLADLRWMGREDALANERRGGHAGRWEHRLGSLRKGANSAGPSRGAAGAHSLEEGRVIVVIHEAKLPQLGTGIRGTDRQKAAHSKHPSHLCVEVLERLLVHVNRDVAK
jgi:hypothetical protein